MELDYANIQSDSELFKALLLGTFNADAQSEEVRDLSDAFVKIGESFFVGHFRNNAPCLANKITGKVKALMKCEYYAFQGDTLNLAWGVVAPKDSNKEPTAAPIQEWAGFLLSQDHYL